MNADSVKARLKTFAIKNGCTFQEALTYYGLERTIYRISVSKYAEHFVLKGGIFLYAIFDRNYERATTDVDLLAQRISNSSEEMKSVFQDIFSQDIDDALVFDIDSITVDNITEFKEYHGILISAVAYLDRTKIPVVIDIAFGDEFLNDPMHQTRWKAFLKKKKALIQVSMSDAMDWIKEFIRPLLDGTEKTKWNPETGIWEE